MCACSTNLELTTKFGINTVFGFWDWVGGRFSVCSAIGILPLSIHFGFETMEQFLKGAEYID
jgi:glucose-6-phosphate isomerase